MTTLYNLHTDGDLYRITKFVDGEPESSYVLNHDDCQCPAGHRPPCRHRQMLPLMLSHNLLNAPWFWDFDRQRATDFNGLSIVVEAKPAIKGIECFKCGQLHPSNRIYDKTPCARCGNLLTAYVTDKDGKRLSQDEYLTDIPTTSWRRI